MKRLSIFLTVIFSFIALVSFKASADSSEFKIGATIEDFKLTDVNGKEQSFNSLKGKNGAVIVFLSTQCPIVRGYNERINKLAEEYQAKGISFIGINSNASESPDEIKNHAAEHYKFPVLIDKGNVLADKLSASATPEMYFFDAKNTLIYHGAIDNDRSGRNVNINYLSDALEENLAGKPVTKAETKAFGCSIRRVGQ